MDNPIFLCISTNLLSFPLTKHSTLHKNEPLSAGAFHPVSRRPIWEIFPENGYFARIVHIRLSAARRKTPPFPELYKISISPQDWESLWGCGETGLRKVVKRRRTGFPHAFEKWCGKLHTVLSHNRNPKGNAEDFGLCTHNPQFSNSFSTTDYPLSTTC